MLNQHIQNYKITSLLGEGGMAKVYLAEHNLLGNNTAIKLLNKEFTHNNNNIRKRFLAEAKSMARMSHPNIIKVIDLIDDGDTVAFVMEYVEGETLKEYIERKGKLSDEEIKSIFSQMLDSLGYVHEQNLVHRDIKPSNFMIDTKSKVKLMDFGIAKNTDVNAAEYTQTGTGMQMGTPMYMSPEQITETKSVTFQSDIYSLGVVLWQMVTGEKPYDTRTLSIFQLQTKIVQEELQKSYTIWDSIIAKSTQKNPFYRYVTCSEVLQSIDQLNKKNKSNFSENLVASESIDLDEKTIVTLSPERSSKNYNVKIGGQNWMSKNLDVVTFRNGDRILEVKSMVDWENAIKNKKPAWCNYNFDPSNNDKFGKIYNWYAINDYRLLAPENYRLPSANDFKRLINFLGGMEVAGNKSRATKKNNFNDSRFSGVPGGYIDQNGFQRLDVDCAWWTDNQGKYENPEGNSKIFKLISKGLNYFFVESEATKKCGFSVRCIKGDPTKSSLKNKNLNSEKTLIDSNLTRLNSQVRVNNSNSLDSKGFNENKKIKSEHTLVEKNRTSGESKMKENILNEKKVFDQDRLDRINKLIYQRNITERKNKIILLFKELVGNYKVYLLNEIPAKKLSNFLQFYNDEFVSNSEFLVYFDNTVFGKGDDGFLILIYKDRFYFFYNNYSPNFKMGMCLEKDNTNCFIKGYKKNDLGIILDVIDKDDKKNEVKINQGSEKLLNVVANFIDLFVK